MRLNKHQKILLLLFLGLSIFLLGCKGKKDEQQDFNSPPFDMYELSPMAMLMEQMYVDNMRIKSQILAGETDFGEFPVIHESIFSAQLTDPSDKDEFFEWQARYFIEVEKAFYQSKETDKKSQFNAIINSCLECHKSKCGGPIPRIKKLLIP
jgi:hypothetical protein